MWKILNQWSQKNCGVYALWAILQHKWIIVPDELFLIDAPYIGKLEKLFKEAGLIKKFLPLRNPKLVDLWLRKWEYLLTSTKRGDFTLQDNIGWLVEFDEKSQHFFVIVEDCWDKWKCQNSWGEWYWDNWYMYMKKNDFRFIQNPCKVNI
jgi:hypothetical protein